MANPDPWDEWRKRSRTPILPGFPAEFEKEFERIREEMERMVALALRGAFPQGLPGAPPPNARPGQPFMYGFTMRVGPDGKPHFQEFGNARPLSPDATEGARQPITDVIEGEKDLAVTIELPGVAREEINLHVAEDRITIRVNSGRRYYKEIDLPSPVVPKTANATFKNGVLDLTIERAHARSDPGFKVDIR